MRRTCAFWAPRSAFRHSFGTLEEVLIFKINRMCVNVERSFQKYRVVPKEVKFVRVSCDVTKLMYMSVSTWEEGGGLPQGTNHKNLLRRD